MVRARRGPCLSYETREKIRQLGEAINWTVMQIPWLGNDAHEIHYKVKKIREIYKELEKEIEQIKDNIDKECDVEALMGALAQIKELISFTVDELKNKEEPHASAVTWLARAGQEILFLLHRY